MTYCEVIKYGKQNERLFCFLIVQVGVILSAGKFHHAIEFMANKGVA